MLVVIGGMIRSGSTLQYQVAVDLVERFLDGEGIGFFEGEDLEKAVAGLDAGANKVTVLKTHVCSTYIWHYLIEHSDAKVFYSYRDLRDVAVSACRQFDKRIEHLFEDGWLKRSVTDYFLWKSLPITAMSKYEEFVNDLAGLVESMAGHLGISVSHEEVVEIAERFSRERQKKRMKNADESSLLHKEHIGSGASWQDVLAPEEVQLIEKQFGGWLLLKGYSLSEEVEQPTKIVTKWFESEIIECALESRYRRRLEKMLAVYAASNETLKKDVDNLKDHLEAMENRFDILLRSPTQYIRQYLFRQKENFLGKGVADHPEDG